MLKVDHITRSFDGFVAVDDMSIEVPDNGLVGLIGPNGAGKSTLFSLVSGFMTPDRGTVHFGGEDITRFGPAKRARRGLARSFQVPREFTHMTVRENLAVAVPNQPGEQLIPLYFAPGTVRRREREVMREVDEVIELTSLGKVAETPAGKLSGGQRKLLELGKLLLARPRLMLLDEPFAGVNPVLIGELSDFIRQIHAERGIGFLIVEHNLGALTRLVDTLFVMDRGKLLAHGDPKTVLADPVVHSAYIGNA